jgi:hypothetical protein
MNDKFVLVSLSSQLANDAGFTLNVLLIRIMLIFRGINGPNEMEIDRRLRRKKVTLRQTENIQRIIAGRVAILIKHSPSLN